MTFTWDDEKNEKLKQLRNISFEEIVICISEGQVVTVLEHPQKALYQNQFLYLVEYKNYIYVVPHVCDERKQEIFLKTIYPSRKYTNRYLGEGNKNEER